MVFIDADDYFNEVATIDDVRELFGRGFLFLHGYGELNVLLKEARVMLSMRSVFAKYLIANNSTWKSIASDCEDSRIAKFSFLSCFLEIAKDFMSLFRDEQYAHGRAITKIIDTPFQRKSFKVTAWRTQDWSKARGVSFLFKNFIR